ncbi:MAG TPA: hypothetical protein VK929_04445 [Longimicrobiales bacterium]|nr:hypothetical protein [Longimicrobiales bacterium]
MNARRVHALAPLFLRWDVLALLLFFGGWAVIAPLLLLHEAGGIHLLWQAGGSPQVQAARWLLIVLVAANTGLAGHGAMEPLLKTPAGFLLPGVRRRLMTGTALVALPLVLGAAGLAALSAAGTSGGAVLFHAAAGAGGALVGLAVGAVISDGAMPRLWRWPPAFLLIAAVVRPGPALAFVNASPLLAAVLAALVAAALLSRQWTPATGRARALSPAAFGGGTIGSGSRFVTAPGGAGALHTGRLLPWLRAAAVEGRGLPLAHVATGVVAGVFAYVLDMPHMVLIVAGSGLSARGMQLAGGLVYPLHRRRRAQLAFAGCALDALTFCLAAGTCAALLHALGAPYWDEGTSAVGWVPSLAMTLALAPVAQWGAIRRAAAGTGFRDTSSMQALRPMLWFALLAVALLAAIRFTGLHDDGARLLPGILLVAGVCWSLSWLAIRRLYVEGDLLVVTPSS